MGTDKLNSTINTNRDTYTNVSGIKATEKSPKPMLVKISAKELKAQRISAYKYLLP